MTTPIETKIAALIAKAEATDNAHEAEAFMAHAERLMLQHGIERAALEAHRPGVKQAPEIVVEKVYIPNGHGYAMAMIHIAFNIGPSFSVKVLQSTDRKGGKTAWLIGHKSDVQDSLTLLTTLLIQCVPQAKTWWRQEGRALRPYATDNDAYLARREFIFAFASGVGARLRETRQSVIAEAGAGTELVLVERSQVVDAWIEQNMEVGKARSTTRNYGGSDATRAGRQAGREAVSSRALR